MISNGMKNSDKKMVKEKLKNDRKKAIIRMMEKNYIKK